MTPSPATAKPRSLGESARASLLWGGGFTLLRDVAQFAVMLVLVRLLAPADYGLAALVQSILGVVSIVSFGTFSTHALQIRNPDDIDWQAQFTAGAVLNTALAALVILVAAGLSFWPRFAQAALPLAALTVVLLIEVAATLRHRMLEANHDWQRFRVLLAVGTLLGLGSGLAVALMGGGVWALIVQVPMLGLPAAIDLLIIQRFRPDWSWSWARYRDTAYFGFNRIGAGGVGRVRQLVESGMMAAAFDFATLGIYSRAMGLATLLVGRIGAVASSALYPVVTRADPGSERFQRLAGLMLRGIAWTTIPIAAFLALTAADTVHLLYGSRWGGVVPLLAMSAVLTGLLSVSSALSNLLLANERLAANFWIESLAGACSILVAVAAINHGPKIYLLAQIAQAAIFFAIVTAALIRSGGLDIGNGVDAFVPPLLAASLGLSAATIVGFENIGLRMLLQAVIFAVGYLMVLRCVFPRQTAELLQVSLGSSRLGMLLRIKAKPLE